MTYEETRLHRRAESLERAIRHGCIMASLALTALAIAPKVTRSQQYEPLELRPYHVSLVLVQDGALQSEEMAEWKRGLQEMIPARLGRLCIVDHIEAVDLKQARNWKSFAKDVDKVFVASVGMRGGKPRVVVEMHDVVVGDVATQQTFSSLVVHPRLTSATFWALVGCFGPRGQVVGTSDGQLIMRIQGSAIRPLLKGLTFDSSGFGYVVSDGPGQRLRLPAIIRRESATRFLATVYDPAAVEDRAATFSLEGMWFVGQSASTSGTWLEAAGAAGPLGGLEVVVAALDRPSRERRVGQTSAEGALWVPRQPSPVWLLLRAQGVTVWQRVLWPGAETEVVAALDWDDAGWEAVSELAQARVAVLEGATEFRALVAKSAAARRAGRGAEANTLEEQARRRWQELQTRWKPVVTRLAGRAWPPETSAAWKIQCRELLQQLQSQPQ